MKGGGGEEVEAVHEDDGGGEEVGGGVDVDEYNRQPPLQNRLRKLCIEPGMIAVFKLAV